MSDTEQNRLQEAHENGQAWSRWGPYLSERQWGTVREDYSPGGTAWDFLPHDQTRSHAYRWGEDGLLGISDDQRRRRCTCSPRSGSATPGPGAMMIAGLC